MTRIDVVGAEAPGQCEILTDDALGFVAQLHERFAAWRDRRLTSPERA